MRSLASTSLPSSLPATVALARPAAYGGGYILHADGVVELTDAAVRRVMLIMELAALDVPATATALQA
jgi:hypothetical protein